MRGDQQQRRLQQGSPRCANARRAASHVLLSSDVVSWLAESALLYVL